jgi:aminopeptidase N
VRLDSSMRVVRVLIDGRPNTRLSRTMYGRSEDDLVVPHRKSAGDSITTRMRYHGLARANAKVGGNGRGDRIFFAEGADEGARFWLPIPERTDTDRAAVSFRIQAPLAQRAVANGVLAKVDTLPYGDAIWSYRMDVPIPIASFAAASGPYQVRSLTPGRCGDGCPVVEVWSYAGDSATGGLTRAWEMVEAIAAKAGRFPYGRLAHVEAPVAGIVSVPGIVFHPERSLGGAGPADSIVARETARQWFGLAIWPADPADRWLVDGLATYVASLWRDPSGRSAERRAPRGPQPEDVRGAGALHRLRKATGDSAFFAGLARFAGEHLHRPVTRADFVRSMSDAAGRDLQRDLQQALDGAS